MVRPESPDEKPAPGSGVGAAGVDGETACSIDRSGMDALLDGERKGRKLRAGEGEAWNRGVSWRLGLDRLRGAARDPNGSPMLGFDRPPASRGRETRMHGLEGGLDPHRAEFPVWSQ